MNKTFTTSDGAQYKQDEYGIHQTNAKPFVYDETYCAIYDSEERQSKTKVLQALRLGFIIGAFGSTPESILDYGCGNYDFLKTAKEIIPFCWGYDVATYGAPDGVCKVKDVSGNYDVICFHDVLEHIENPEFVTGLHCEMLVVSLPNRLNAPGITTAVYDGVNWNLTDNYINWFDKDYFHRKPDEHLHHFSPDELCAFMASCGWHVVCISNHEDVIRKRGEWNIISMAFKRRK